MQIRINNLEKENEKLKQEQPLNYNKWRQWTSKEVYRFIMNIYPDNTLDEYKHAIYKEIHDSEYCGDDLEDLNIEDVKSMGIMKIKIRKKVFNEIKKLTQNINNNNDNIHVEGVNGAPTAYI